VPPTPVVVSPAAFSETPTMFQPPVIELPIAAVCDSYNDWEPSMSHYDDVQASPWASASSLPDMDRHIGSRRSVSSDCVRYDQDEGRRLKSSGTGAASIKSTRKHLFSTRVQAAVESVDECLSIGDASPGEAIGLRNKRVRCNRSSMSIASPYGTLNIGQRADSAGSSSDGEFALQELREPLECVENYEGYKENFSGPSYGKALEAPSCNERSISDCSHVFEELNCQLSKISEYMNKVRDIYSSSSLQKVELNTSWILRRQLRTKVNEVLRDLIQFSDAL